MVQTLSPEKAVVALFGKALVQFSLPRNLLPEDAAVGDEFSLQIVRPDIASETHDRFAQRLLEDIVNGN